MNHVTRTTLLALGLSAAMTLAGTGCDSPKTDGAASSGAASSGGKTTQAPTAQGSTTAAKAPEEPKPAELVEKDLSTADPKWAGWVAKGPADAQVMADGVNGARIAGKGPNLMERKPGGDEGFDIAFGWGKDDLKSLKENLQKGADAAKSKLTFIKDEAGALEYTMETGDTKSYNFVIHMNVEKTDITCKNGNAMGAGNEAQHKSFMEACKTLAKKAK